MRAAWGTVFGVWVLGAFGCSPAPITAWDPPEAPWVRSDRARLRDDAGRALVFRGINARVEGLFDVTFDDGRMPVEEIPAFTVEDARRMRELGLNALRLPVNWSGIEPTQGVYDEAYLTRLDEVVAMCREAGVHVIIDFHQDAYSKEIGEDGAPLWAIHPAPTMLLGGPLEGDELQERRLSPQVLDAFTGFFDTTDADTTDVMLQAAYAAMVRHVAERYAGEPWVLGYDLYNEPIAADSLLRDFHARLAAEIREVDADHLILFEPSATRNVIERAAFSPDPFPDDGGLYAVHLYTLAFLDPDMELDRVTQERLRPNIERALREAATFDVPIFVGEWGIRPDSPGSASYVRFMHELFDETFASATVWLWKENSQGSWGFHDYDEATGTFTERESVIAAHARIYAEAIAGEPSVTTYDPDAHRYELRYQGRGDDAPSVIYVPPSIAAFTVRCGGTELTPTPPRDPATGRIEVVCAGPGERTVQVDAR